MPSVTTVNGWKKKHPALSVAIACAREEGFDAIAAECLAIADDTRDDTISTDKGDFPNKEWILRSRLRVETRLKLLSKWDPKRYGDKIEHEVGGDLDIKIRIGGDANS